MSLSQAINTVFRDLFSENGLTPWWERIRGYFFALTAISAISLATAEIFAIDITCLPVYKNGSDDSDYTNARKELIETFCKRELPWYDRYAWLIDLGSTACIFLTTNLWLLTPDVTNAVFTFKKTLEKLETLQYSQQDLIQFYVEPMSSENTDNNRSELRMACLLLWKYRPSLRIVWLYRFRCIFLSFVLGGLFGYFGYEMQLLLNGSDIFNCTLVENIRLQVYGPANVWNSYYCTSNKFSSLFAFGVLRIISLNGQLVFTVYGLAKTLHLIDRRMKTIAVKQESFAKFMITFWKNAQPHNIRDICDFINCMFSEKTKPMMQKQLPTAFDCLDYQYFTGCSTFLESKHVLHMLLEKFKEAAYNELERFIAVEEPMIKILRTISYSLDDAKELVTRVKEEKRWRLMVAILEHVCPSEKSWLLSVPWYRRKVFHIDWIKDLNLKLDKSESHEQDSDSNSILYYALRNDIDMHEDNFRAANYIICSHPNIFLCVYENGTKRMAKEFANTEHKNNLSGQKSLEKIPELNSKSNISPTTGDI